MTQLKVRAGVILLTVLFISACAGFVPDSPSLGGAEQSTALNDKEVMAFIEEWKQAKPRIEALNAMGDDLAIILDEVNRQTKLDNLPSQYAGKKETDYYEDDSAYLQDEPTKHSEEYPEEDENHHGEEKEQAVERQTYAAHLSFFLREETARQGWGRLKRRFPALGKAFDAKVERIDKDKQTLYSLRIGPLQTKESTGKLCHMFRQYRFACQTVPFQGALISGDKKV